MTWYDYDKIAGRFILDLAINIGYFLQSENIHSIRDALDGISVKEEVTGCVASNGLETEAWKQMSLEVLPAILILHMKRFVFDTTVNTIRKLDKRVDFSIDLEIAKGKYC